jgi:hypothetical protein
MWDWCDIVKVEREGEEIESMPRVTLEANNIYLYHDLSVLEELNITLELYGYDGFGCNCRKPGIFMHQFPDEEYQELPDYMPLGLIKVEKVVLLFLPSDPSMCFE